MITYDLDQKAKAWGYFLRQHRNKPMLEAFVKAFYSPRDKLNKAFKDMRELRGVDTATGAQLDGVGVIVGVGRIIPKAVFVNYFGYVGQPNAGGYSQAPYRQSFEANATGFALGDDAYRRLIKAKIIHNNNHGTFEEIIASAKLLFDATVVNVTRSGPAELTIVITRPSTGLNDAASYFESFLPIAAGVTTVISYIDA